MPSRQHRITRGDDYRQTVRSGRRVGGAFCITHAVSHSRGAESVPQESSPARFGYIVSKAVGNSVTRNLLRRRMKTISERLIHEGLVNVDIVFRALPACADASFVDLEAELRRGVAKAMEPRARGERR
ncbi:ribonuclease P protein component [Leucobacter sp. cx-42]|uniref:ribonuclease P protein component n=1 Tax=unclassified Leucobacter TaxID=2621730 RepID=UPI00165DCD4B|nr:MULTISPECIES: ribonuclease P protein component [unclassified Leucobacter]MBC9955271.1 ribonuclease P protein component [Leucobacter sp. cx-42]